MSAVLLAPGEGEQIRKNVRIVVDDESLCVVDFEYPPHRDGPARHIHHEHCDCFFAIEGDLTFHVGGEERVLHPGDFVLVPPGVVHTFRNASDEPAHFLNFHAPAKNFAPYMRGAPDAGFDSVDVEEGGLPASEAIVVRAGEPLDLGRPELALAREAGAFDGGYEYALGEGDVLGFRAPAD